MTFWHNEKYESLENSTLKGDFLRGIPPKNFPWTLKNISSQDAEGDTWQIKVLCLGIEGNELTQKIKARIKLEAQCFVHDANLEKMGIEYQRLYNLQIRDWNFIEDKYEFEITTMLDKLDEKSGEFYKIFFQKIQKKFPLVKKREMVLSKIRVVKISNFSD